MKFHNLFYKKIYIYMPLVLELPIAIFSIYDDISNIKISRNSFYLEKILAVKKLISLNGELISFFHQICEELYERNFLIIKGVTADTQPLIAIVSALAKEVFFCERLGGFYDEFETVPFIHEYSRSIDVRRFHTDFSSMDNPPDYVAIQCIKEDPKHPFYGRNQIVNLDNLLEKIELIIPNAKEKLLNLKFPCKYQNSVSESTILQKKDNKFFIKFHFENIIENMLDDTHHINGEYVHNIVETICLNVSEDFALEKGDIAIISNKLCFHRRGECSLDFEKNKYMGREIRTIRFWV